MVKSVLFITGPPRSGKSTLAGAIAATNPDRFEWIKTRDLCEPGPWMKLGAMFPDEEFLGINAKRVIEHSMKPTIIIDGAPREYGQIKWAEGHRFGVVVLTRMNTNSFEDLARESRWYSIQVHGVARAIETCPHIIGPAHAWLTPEEVLTWWEGLGL